MVTGVSGPLIKAQPPTVGARLSGTAAYQLRNSSGQVSYSLSTRI